MDKTLPSMHGPIKAGTVYALPSMHGPIKAGTVYARTDESGMPLPSWPHLSPSLSQHRQEHTTLFARSGEDASWPFRAVHVQRASARWSTLGGIMMSSSIVGSSSLWRRVTCPASPDSRQKLMLRSMTAFAPARTSAARGLEHLDHLAHHLIEGKGRSLCLQTIQAQAPWAGQIPLPRRSLSPLSPPRRGGKGRGTSLEFDAQFVMRSSEPLRKASSTTP